MMPVRVRDWIFLAFRHAGNTVLTFRTAIRINPRRTGWLSAVQGLLPRSLALLGPERHAEHADLVFQAASLDAPLPGGQEAAALGDFMGEEDPHLEHALDIQSVWTHWDDLPERQQKLLMMRFYGNMSQAEIGDRLGISQMHVSRLLAAALDYLREQIVGAEAGPRS